MLAQERLNSDRTTQMTRTPSCPESEVRIRIAGRAGSCAASHLSGPYYGGGRRLCDGGVPQGTTAPGSGSRGAGVGTRGARVRETGLLSPHDRALGLGVEGCSRTPCSEVEDPGAARGPFKLERGRGRGARAVEGAAPPSRRDQGRGCDAGSPRRAAVVRAGRRCLRVPSAAPTAPGLLLAGRPAARPPPVGAEMAGPWAAAGCARRVLEQLRRVSPGLRAAGPVGRSGCGREGSRSSSAPARPVLGRCSPRGKGAPGLGRQCGRPKGEPVLFPTPESIT